MTHQETFDKAVGGVLAQGKLALVRNDEYEAFSCRYRVPIEGSAETLKCVAGQLIPDDKYDPKWDETNGVLGSVMANHEPIASILKAEGHDPEFCHSLQNFHDQCANAADPMKQFVQNMKNVATIWELKWNFSEAE